jgi:hypothetical protein
VTDPARGLSPDATMGQPAKPDADGGFPPTEQSPGSRWWRVPMALVFVAFAAFWIWALFFASKEAVNKIEDRAWAARAEQICAAAQEERDALVSFERVDPDDPVSRARSADLFDQATDILEEMINNVVAEPPSDPKGQDIVPLWEADYRTYLGNRREFAESLRRGDEDPFAETPIDGIPISEKIATFAGDNEMPSCSPPQAGL